VETKIIYVELIYEIHLLEYQLLERLVCLSMCAACCQWKASNFLHAVRKTVLRFDVLETVIMSSRKLACLVFCVIFSNMKRVLYTFFKIIFVRNL
jgi:hypothetical protein